MDWFLSATTGWVLTAMIFLGFGWALYRQRKKKADHLSKHWPPIPVDGFGYVNVPKKDRIGDEISFDEAQIIAAKLYTIQLEVWNTCVDVYKVSHSTNEGFQQGARGWCVDEVGITNDPEVMPDGHPYIAWSMPHGGVKLLLQSMMYFWYAHEVHNIFRYVLHGPLHIYDTVDSTDKANSVEVMNLINRDFR